MVLAPEIAQVASTGDAVLAIAGEGQLKSSKVATVASVPETTWREYPSTKTLCWELIAKFFMLTDLGEDDSCAACKVPSPGVIPLWTVFIFRNSMWNRNWKAGISFA